MADKVNESSPMTTIVAKSALGGGAMGPSQVPSKENLRSTENLAIGRSADRSKERIVRKTALDTAGNVHYYIDGGEVSKDDYFAKTK